MIELPKEPLKGKIIVTENVAVLNQASKTQTRAVQVWHPAHRISSSKPLVQVF